MKSNINFFFEIIGKVKILLLFLLIILTTFFDLLSIGLILPALNYFIYPNDQNFLLNFLYQNQILSNYEPAFLIIVLILSTFLVKIFLSLISAYYLTIIGKEIKISVSKKIFLKFLSFNYKSIIKNKIPNIIRIFSYDVENFVHSLNNYIVMIVEIFLLSSIIILLMYINIVSTLLIFGVFILVIVVFYIGTLNFRKKFAFIKQIFTSKLIKNFSEGFSAIKEIFILRKEKFFYSLFLNNLLKREDAFQKTVFITIFPRFLIEITAVLIICFFLFFIVKSGKEFISYISLIGVYLVAMLRMIPSINKLIYAVQTIQLTKPSVISIKREWNKNSKPKDFKEDNEELSFFSKIELKNIYFNYDDSAPILKNFSLEIKKGEKILIYGKSGSGKSTLLDIFSGLQKPKLGDILVDGKNIHDDKNLPKWFNTISYVPQNTFIFDENLFVNLILDNKFSSKINNIKRVLKEVNLNKIFYNKNNIIYKNLGEKGNKLSGGQRQRVALCRYILRNKNIMILDESLNSLDKVLQMKILKKLMTKKNLTVLAVSHDLEIRKMFKKHISI